MSGQTPCLHCMLVETINQWLDTQKDKPVSLDGMVEAVGFAAGNLMAIARQNGTPPAQLGQMAARLITAANRQMLGIAEAGTLDQDHLPKRAVH